jgi:Phage capsid family
MTEMPAYAEFMESRKHPSLRAFTDRKEAYNAGMWFKALAGDHDAKKFIVEKYGGSNPNTAGGFLVPIELEARIVALRDAAGVFRRNAMSLTTGSDNLSVPKRSTGLTAYPIGENTALTESQVVWDQISLGLKKWATLTRLSTELVEDSVVGLGDAMTAEIGYCFARLEDSLGFSVSTNGTSTLAACVALPLPCPALPVRSRRRRATTQTPNTTLLTTATSSQNFQTTHCRMPNGIAARPLWRLDGTAISDSRSNLRSATLGKQLKFLNLGSNCPNVVSRLQVAKLFFDETNAAAERRLRVKFLADFAPFFRWPPLC